MKEKFRVEFNYEVGGFTIVEAESRGDAMNKVYAILDDVGIEGIREHKINYREYNAVNAREVKDD